MGHWVTIGGRHVLIEDTGGPARKLLPSNPDYWKQKDKATSAARMQGVRRTQARADAAGSKLQSYHSSNVGPMREHDSTAHLLGLAYDTPDRRTHGTKPRPKNPTGHHRVTL